MPDDKPEVLQDISEEQKLRDALGLKDISIKHYQDEVQELKAEVNKLTALLYRLCDQFDNDFFAYSSAFMNNQNIARSIKSKLVMTPEIWDIVNNSKQTAEQTDSS